MIPSRYRGIPRLGECVMKKYKNAVLFAIFPAALAIAQPPSLRELAERNYSAAKIIRSVKISAPTGCRAAKVTATATDPLTGRASEFSYYFYEPEAPRVRKTSGTIIFPSGGVDRVGPWMGAFQERLFAKSLCREGIPAAIIITHVDPGNGKIALRSHDENLLRSSVYAKRVAQRFSGEYAVMGLSGGGVVAAFLLAIENRATHGVVVATGLPFADVLAETRESHARRLRNFRMRASGLATVTEYRDQIRAAFTLDPGRISGSNLSRKPVVFVVAGRDKMMPTHLQRQAVSLFNDARVIERPKQGHLSTVATTYWLNRKSILDFLRQSN